MRCGTAEPNPGAANAVVVPSDCGYWTNVPKPGYEPTFFYEIPVVFHVLQNTAGDGYLSSATIQDQIDVLNEDFQAIAGSPGAPGTNARIRFHLARTDPAGNPTTGITCSTDDGGGCGSGPDCDAMGDLMCDTNNQANATSGCPPSVTSCGNPDPIHNYMDYTDDPCLWEFTPEQVNRMRCTLENWRPALFVTVHTRDARGVPVPVAPPRTLR